MTPSGFPLSQYRGAIVAVGATLVGFLGAALLSALTDDTGPLLFSLVLILLFAAPLTWLISAIRRRSLARGLGAVLLGLLAFLAFAILLAADVVGSID